MNPTVASCVDRVIDDDWRFTFSCSDPNTGLAFNLIGYTPGGVLSSPLGMTLDIVGGLVDYSQLSLGIFTFNIPRATTATFVPDETSYRLQVYLIDPTNIKRTYGVVPIRVFAA